MSLCVVDGLHCRCQPPEVPCDGVVKLNAEIERMKGEIAAKDATISAAVRGESIACDALRQRIAEKDAEIAALRQFVGAIIERDDGAPYNWDGGEIQELEVSCGLLVPVEVSESCGDECNCYDFPVTCYRESPLALACLKSLTAPQVTGEKP